MENNKDLKNPLRVGRFKTFSGGNFLYRDAAMKSSGLQGTELSDKTEVKLKHELKY